jgi:hypothetical protein
VIRERVVPVVFAATQGGQRQTTEFTGPLVLGSIASLAFAGACRLGFRQEWGFALTGLFGAGGWPVLARLPRWLAP